MESDFVLPTSARSSKRHRNANHDEAGDDAAASVAGKHVAQSARWRCHLRCGREGTLWTNRNGTTTGSVENEEEDADRAAPFSLVGVSSGGGGCEMRMDHSKSARISATFRQRFRDGLLPAQESVDCWTLRSRRVERPRSVRQAIR